MPVDFVGRVVLYATASALVAVPITFVLLGIFKRSVVRGMRQHTEGAVARDLTAPVADRSAPYGRPTLEASDFSLLAAVAVYLLAGAAFGAAFVLTLYVQMGGFSLLAAVYTLPQYTAPVLFVAWVLLPKGALRRIVTGFLVVLGVLMVAVPLLLSPAMPVWPVIQTLLWPNLYAALLVLAFMTRRVRAAGPLVLTIVAAAVVAVNAVFDVIEADEGVMTVLAAVEGLITGPVLMFLIISGGTLLGVASAYPVLRGLGAAYKRKLLSDQSLVVDIVFAWFSLFYASEMASDGPLWVLSGAVAFLVFKAVSLIGFGVLGLLRSERAHADILLLRPFALGRRSEKLFDALSKVWLRIGAIHMIAGPDLVMATVAPPEFLVFLSGRMSRRFILNAEDLQQHLDGLDLEHDPDGRYRINQLFCGDDMWREAMRGLARRSTAILMDLRGFTAANQGCVYEIGELVRGVPLSRVVFAVDQTTDRAFLDYAVEEVRRQLPADTANPGMAGIASRVVSVDNSARGRRALLAALMDSIGIEGTTDGRTGVSELAS